MVFRVLTALTCAFVFVLGCQPGEEGGPASESVGTAEPAPGEAAATGADEVVARVGGKDVTLAELDDWIKDDLFKRQTSGANPSRVYDLRDEYLDRLINTRLLSDEAARRNTTEDALLEEEVAAMGEITDEEVAQFYEEQESQMRGQTLEVMAPQIRAYLRQVRSMDVVKKMRDEAGVEVLLEPPRLDVAAEGPSRGPEDATVTIIEFSDFQCPYCSRALPVIEEVLERYPDDVRIVYRNMPLDKIHAHARPAAEAALCAGDQGQFWAYHDTLFANRTALGDEDLKKYAGDLGLDVPAWEQCMADGKFSAKVDEDVEAARSIGVTGTPAFVINGVLVSGAKPVEHFVSMIERELERAGKTNRS